MPSLEDEFQKRLSQVFGAPDELGDSLATLRYFFFGGALAAVDRISLDGQSAVVRIEAECEELNRLMDRGEF